MAHTKYFARKVGPTRLVAIPTRTGDDFAKLFAAYGVSLKHRLRAGVGNKVEWRAEQRSLKPYLSEYSLNLMSSTGNRPLMVLNIISDWLNQHLGLGEAREALEHHLDSMANGQSACERIINTPTPYPYVVQIRQLLFLYLFTLPVSFQSIFAPWVSIGATFLVSFGLLGIEEAGKIIENPFGTDKCDLPLEEFCEKIEKDTAGIIKAFRRFQTDFPLREVDERPLPPIEAGEEEHKQHH